MKDVPVCRRFDHTTFPPFAAYAVEGWWLDNLLKAGSPRRCRELKWSMRNFPEVEAFLDCHTGAPAFRRPI